MKNLKNQHFDNAINSIYFSTITQSTMGYGDIYQNYGGVNYCCITNYNDYLSYQLRLIKSAFFLLLNHLTLLLFHLFVLLDIFHFFILDSISINCPNDYFLKAYHNLPKMNQI